MSDVTNGNRLGIGTFPVLKAAQRPRENRQRQRRLGADLEAKMSLEAGADQAQTAQWAIERIFGVLPALVSRVGLHKGRDIAPHRFARRRPCSSASRRVHNGIRQRVARPLVFAENVERPDPGKSRAAKPAQVPLQNPERRRIFQIKKRNPRPNR